MIALQLRWQGRQDLNLRHPVLETGALPTELLPSGGCPLVEELLHNTVKIVNCHLFWLFIGAKIWYTSMYMSKIVPTRPLLVMLYGFPGSGKTFFARQFCESIQAAHVQGDRIRFELFEKPRYDKQENAVITQLMDYMTQEFLNAGVSVVYDTNAMRAVQRHALREMARKSHAQPLLVWLQIDAETAYLRSNKRDRRRSDDKYTSPIDRSAFDSITGHMQNPQSIEEYLVVSGKHTFTTQYTAVLKRLRELNIVSMEDANSHVVKPGLVNLVPNAGVQNGRVDMSRRNIVIR